MRNAVFVFIIVFIIVVAGGGSLAWYLQALESKKSVERTIAALNAPLPVLTYESITTLGFPENVIVAIRNPRFTGRVDTLFKTIVEKMPEGPEKAHKLAMVQAMPEWNEDITLDGTIFMAINALSDRYTMTINGNWHNNATIGGQAIATASQSAGDTVCTLQMDQGGGWFGSLWNFGSLLREGRDFAKDFRLVDCIWPAYSITNAASDDVLMSSGNGRIYISSIPENLQQKIRFFLKSTDLEVTPAGDQIMTAYLQALSPASAFPSKLSVYGKQNAEIDFSYAGPRDWKNDGSTAPLNMELTKLNIVNQAYSADAVFNLSSSTANGSRLAKLSFKGVTTANESYDILIQDMARQYIQQIYAGKVPDFTPLPVPLQKYTADEFYALMSPAIPNFHSLGTLTNALDVSYQGSDNFSAGDFTIAALELSASPYGITGNGTAKTTAGQLFPQANISLTCSNCLRMIDDLAAYAQRVQKAMAAIDADLAAFIITDPKAVEGIKSFLSAVAMPSNPANPNTFTYAIVSDNQAGISISGKPMNEVMALYQQYVRSVLERPPAEEKPETVLPSPAKPKAN